MPQFDDNPYMNPNMGGNLFNQDTNKGGGFQPAGNNLPPSQQGHNLGLQGWDQPSPMNDWLNSFRPDEAQWQGGGGATPWGSGGGGSGGPGRLGQNLWWNPQNGQVEYSNMPGMDVTGITGTNATSLWSIDPITGNKTINMDALRGMTQGGGGGYNKFQASDYQGNPMNAPAGYGGGDWDVARNVTNVNDVIESYRPTMEANIGEGFAEAGSRLGQSGFAMSTPYAQELGDVERLARDQMNQRGLEYQYNAGQFDANNEMTAMMGKNQENFGAWQQAGNWDMDAQGQNNQNDFNQWMAQNQWGFQDNQGQNQYNQQNDYNQQQMLMSLMGGLF